MSCCRWRLAAQCSASCTAPHTTPCQNTAATNLTMLMYNAPQRTWWSWARSEAKVKHDAFPWWSSSYQTEAIRACCFLPFPEPKKQSISTLEREWDTQSVELGTSPSCGGLRSVVRTRHQPGRSLGRSNSSTVWPGEESRQQAYRGEPSHNLTVKKTTNEQRIKTV